MGGRFHVLEALERGLDRLEVGEHAAEPTVVDVGHAGARRFFGDDLARLALGADKQHGTLVGRQLADVAQRVAEQRGGLLKVDDVDAVAMAEDVRGHARVPVPGLVAEVNTSLQHLTHC